MHFELPESGCLVARAFMEETNRIKCHDSIVVYKSQIFCLDLIQNIQSQFQIQRNFITSDNSFVPAFLTT